jgi:hypothetical protein
MRHLLTDPAFPDIVGEWAAEEASRDLKVSSCANDNHGDDRRDPSDPLRALVARAEIEATRLW